MNAIVTGNNFYEYDGKKVKKFTVETTINTKLNKPIIFVGKDSLTIETGGQSCRVVFITNGNANFTCINEDENVQKITIFTIEEKKESIIYLFFFLRLMK